MVETITPAVAPALAHIIERPRLIARLEEGGGSRVSLFAAPAGYGKTTLARQWGERQTGPVVWHRTTRASGDIALLAVQIDELLASIAPEVPREPGKVASIASVNPSPKPLGRALVRTFEPLTQDVLLIVDEWEAAQTSEAEELLAMLVDGLDIRFVITTRERPEWFVPRLQVYGEGLEIGTEELTMTDDEAAAVLATAGAMAGRARLMRTAAGWPAVLGLAAMSGEIDFSSGHLMSGKLYEFLASELLAGARPETQQALMLLAVASVVDVDRAWQLLGPGADAAMADAAEHGLLAITERKALFFHPLLRDLLIRRFAEVDAERKARLLSRSRRLFDHRLWDEALSVGELSLDPSWIADAIAAALDDLLAAGRTSSLERWVNAARESKAEGGLVDYAEAELRLRRAEFDAALAVASHAARALEGDLAARAHLVAARSAHLGNRAQIRDAHLERARESVTSTGTESILRWMRFAASVQDERPEAEELFADLQRIDFPSYDHELRVATGHLHLGIMRRTLAQEMENVAPLVTLVDKASDPYASTSLLNVYANALSVAGRYHDSLSTTERELAIAEEYELDFVFVFAQINNVRALTGLRRFGDARRALACVDKRLRAGVDPYVECQRSMYSAALEISRGDLDGAAELLSCGLDPRAGASLLAEHRATSALVITALGDRENAEEMAREARRLSQGVESEALLAASAAIRGAQDNEPSQVTAACDEVLDLGAGNALVLAWRASVDVASVLFASRKHRERLMPLLLEANDTAVAKRVGLPVPRYAQRRRGLSAREQEVCELLAQGRTNEEIAKLLYISLSTTKVHVKHIFEKLGVRSRMEAARLWEQDPT
jgi:ATP/maltotriose-dependent transcriptional regulator MalT